MTLLAISTDGLPLLPEAACRSVEKPDIFFAFEEHHLAQARRICHRCPEIRNCLTWALTHTEHGIWAGTTPEQRAELLTRHRKEAS